MSTFGKFESGEMYSIWVSELLMVSALANAVVPFGPNMVDESLLRSSVLRLLLCSIATESASTPLSPSFSLPTSERCVNAPVTMACDRS